MVARALVLAGLVSLTGLASAPALDDASAAGPQQSALEGIRLTEEDSAPLFVLSAREEWAPRFSTLSATRAEPYFQTDTAPRRYEVAISAPDSQTGLGLDFSLAQRASITVDESGDIGRTGIGAEVRVGRNLTDIVRPWRQQSQGAWYMFLASDGQALTWTPETGLPGTRGLRLQDRVTIGDTQIGVSYEFRGLQTSFALTQREISYSNNTSQGWSEDESFLGVTLTWRH